MLNYYVTYTFGNRESREGFLKEIKDNKIDEISKSEDGCHKYDYFYPVDSETQLLLWEKWESEEYQKAHCGREHFAFLGKLKEKYGASTQIEIAKE